MSHRTRILVVDPDPATIARLIGDAAAQATGDADSVEVQGASTEGDATGHLAITGFDAVAVDLSLGSDVTSAVVAEVERRFPGLPVVATVERAGDEEIAQACHLDAAALLVKPYELSMLMQLLHAPAPDAGFSGSCTGVPTALLLALCCQKGQDGVLHLRCEGGRGRPDRRGSIHVEGGQPVHASAGEHTGAEAVQAMLGWPDAEASWLPGNTGCARTIVGRWEGLLMRPAADRDPGDLEHIVAIAYPEVIDKLSRLSQTQDVLGAYLLRHAEVVAGRCTSDIDEPLASRALCRLAHVFFDVEAQPHDTDGREIQTIVGGLRLVLDRVGPPEARFQVGVIVRQAAPVCKSLRRLLRQIDSAFGRAARGKARRRQGADETVAA